MTEPNGRWAIAWNKDFRGLQHFTEGPKLHIWEAGREDHGSLHAFRIVVVRPELQCDALEACWQAGSYHLCVTDVGGVLEKNYSLIKREMNLEVVHVTWLNITYVNSLDRLWDLCAQGRKQHTVGAAHNEFPGIEPHFAAH